MSTQAFLLIFINASLVLFTPRATDPGPNLSTSKPFEIKTIELRDFCGSDGKATLIKIRKNSVDFKVANKNHESYDFWMNANYFLESGTPVGEVKIKGKTCNRKNDGGGFFTSDGKNPKFYFGSRPKSVLYSAQTHTPLTINGKANSKIFGKSWARIKVPRIMIGEDSEKNIYICHTIGMAGCSIEDFYSISNKLKLKNVLMFDGGASIEVGIKKEGFHYHYQKVSNLERKLFSVPAPKVFIVGNFR
jgi:hypothetical protein